VSRAWIERVRRRRRDRRWLATRVAAPLVAVTAAGITLGLVAAGGSADAGEQGGHGATTTAEVTRRDLVDRETFSGTLGYDDERGLPSRLQGTVTWTPPEGAVRTRGQVLYRVDEQPVVLMYGSVPAWRDLSQGDEGADVRQLQRNLVRLGHDPDDDIAIDGDFDWATAQAVMRWQEALGVDETGSVSLGQVVFLPGPRRVASVASPAGTQAGGQAIMQTTSTRRSVTVSLDARRQDLASVGDAQRVVLPDGSAVSATITEVGAVATAAAEGEDPTVAVTLRLGSSAGAGALDAAPVDVEIAKERAEDALAVPVTALLALAGGGYGVERVDEGGGTTVVQVQTGVFADGEVAITGPGIAEGVEVVVPG
jgi:peptidoglycan hydrolase-like protein with peptidoglycan-binding domain